MCSEDTYKADAARMKILCRTLVLEGKMRSQ